MVSGLSMASVPQTDILRPERRSQTKTASESGPVHGHERVPVLAPVSVLAHVPEHAGACHAVVAVADGLADGLAAGPADGPADGPANGPADDPADNPANGSADGLGGGAAGIAMEVVAGAADVVGDGASHT